MESTGLIFETNVSVLFVYKYFVFRQGDKDEKKEEKKTASFAQLVCRSK